MKVLVLAGGMGTRFGKDTEDKPKPMIEVGGKPIIWHIMQIFAKDGFKDFIILLGYKGEVLKKYFSNIRENDWNIQLLDTGLSTIKSQRIKQAEEFIDGEDFFVTYGDDVSDVSPSLIYKNHKKHNKIATLTAFPLTTNFGVVDIDDNGAVIDFREKPVIKNHWINGGFFCFSKEIFPYLNNSEDELEDCVLKNLAGKRELNAFQHDGFWKCMNTKKDNIELEQLIKDGKAPWMVW